MSRLFCWFFALIPLVYYDLVLDATGLPRLMVLAIFLGICIVFCLVKKIELQIPKYYALAYTLYLIVLFLCSINNTYIDYIELIKRASYFLFFIIAFNLAKAKISFTKPIYLLVYISIAIVGVKLLFIDDVYNHLSGLYTVSSSYSHKNIFSSVLGLCIPFILLHSNNKKSKIFSLALISIFVLILQTRSTILGLGIGVIYLLVVNIKLLQDHIKLIRLSSIVVSLASLALLYQLDTLDHFLRMFDLSMSEHIRTSTIIERLYLWKSSIYMFFDHWLSGVGLSYWPIHFPMYGLKIWRLRQGEVMMQRPHNDLLENFTEAGVLGGILYATILLYPLVMAHKKSKTITAFGLIVFFVISLFSFPQERVVPSLLFLMLVAVALQGVKTYKISAWHILILGLFTLTNIVVLHAKIVSEQSFKHYLNNRNHTNSEIQLHQIKSLKNNYHVVDGTSTPIDWYIGVAYMHYNALDSAKMYFNKALSIHPNHMHIYNSMGGVYLSEGRLDSAGYYFNKALELSPYYEDAIYNMAQVYFLIQEYNKAIYTLEKIYDTSAQKYKNRLTMYSKRELERQIELSHGKRKLILNNIYKSETWIHSVVEKSFHNKVLFAQQINTDISYLLNK